MFIANPNMAPNYGLTNQVGSDEYGLYDTNTMRRLTQDSQGNYVHLDDNSPYVPKNIYNIPSASAGFDNKYEYIQGLINQGATYLDNGQPLTSSGDMWGRDVVIPGNAAYTGPDLIDYNPHNESTGFTNFLQAVALAAITGGGMGLFDGVGAAAAGAGEGGLSGLAAGNTAFDAAAGLGGATSAGAGSVGGATSFGGLGAAGTAAGVGGNVSTLADLFSGLGDTTADLYNYTTGGLSGPTASGIPLDAASGMFGPMPNGMSLAEALGSEATAGALSGATGASSAWDLIKQYGQPAAKALGLTKEDGSIDWGKIGSAGAGIAGYLGSQSQADSYSKLADRYDAYGAPSRARYESSFAPGFTMANDPGYMDSLNQSSKATLHGLSAQGQGNPSDNPNAWSQSLRDNYEKTAYPALQNYRTLNANAGGVASGLQYGAQAQGNAIQSNTNGLNALGSAANNIFNPPSTQAQTMADFYKMIGKV